MLLLLLLDHPQPVPPSGKTRVGIELLTAMTKVRSMPDVPGDPDATRACRVAYGWSLDRRWKRLTRARRLDLLRLVVRRYEAGGYAGDVLSGAHWVDGVATDAEWSTAAAPLGKAVDTSELLEWPLVRRRWTTGPIAWGLADQPATLRQLLILRKAWLPWAYMNALGDMGEITPARWVLRKVVGVLPPSDHSAPWQQCRGLVEAPPCWQVPQSLMKGGRLQLARHLLLCQVAVGVSWEVAGEQVCLGRRQVAEAKEHLGAVARVYFGLGPAPAAPTKGPAASEVYCEASGLFVQHGDQAIAERLGISVQQVRTWRLRWERTTPVEPRLFRFWLGADGDPTYAGRRLATGELLPETQDAS